MLGTGTIEVETTKNTVQFHENQFTWHDLVSIMYTVIDSIICMYSLEYNWFIVYALRQKILAIQHLNWTEALCSSVLSCWQTTAIGDFLESTVEISVTHVLLYRISAS